MTSPLSIEIPLASHVRRRRYDREKLARLEAERLLELKSRELWGSNQQLIQITQNLEKKVRERTADLEKSRQLAEAGNQAKSIFLASMSHEIRTPLNGVLGMAEALCETTLSGEQQEMIQTIVESGKLLLSVLNDVLDISKIEAGQMDIENVPFNAEKLFLNIEKLYANKAHEKNLEFTITLSKSAQRWINSDPTRIQQIAGNLISNAIKFTANGKVSVIVDLENIDNKNAKLKLSTIDTGIGIAPEKTSSLFKQFSQLDVSTARKHGGTGLGLSISRKLCKMMGGDIHVKSQLNKGSCFTAILTVELCDGNTVEQNDNIDQIISLIVERKIKILLAEDNKTNQLVFKKLTKNLHAEITIAENGNQTVDIWNSKKFDLIFMDINMPYMDGLEATQLIRKHEKQNNKNKTPIIALTANTMVHQITEYMSIGMDGYVAKPVRKKTVILKIAGALKLT